MPPNIHKSLMSQIAPPISTYPIPNQGVFATKQRDRKIGKLPIFHFLRHLWVLNGFHPGSFTVRVGSSPFQVPPITLAE